MIRNKELEDLVCQYLEDHTHESGTIWKKDSQNYAVILEVLPRVEGKSTMYESVKEEHATVNYLEIHVPRESARFLTEGSATFHTFLDEWDIYTGGEAHIKRYINFLKPFVDTKLSDELYVDHNN